jgi:L-threonylcarbamoyladenylate synthase
MFFALEPALESLTELGVRTRTAAAALLPGAVTLLLPNPGQRFSLVCDPLGTRPALLGLRVPALSGPLAAVGLPAAQSSANFSGGPDPKRLADVPVELREGADLVLDGGELPGVPSTVVDLSEYEERGEWRVVREGPLTRAEVELILASC